MKDLITKRRIIKQKIIVQEKETSGNAFKAITKAVTLLRSEGYTIGSMCGDEPIGFAKSDKINYIAKWRNIGQDEYQKLSGIITVDNLNNTRNGFRDGNVTINYFKES